MRFRWLSTFTVIGILLIVLGVVGLLLGQRFVYDPGQITNGKEPWCYLAVGALMVLNGLMTPPAPAEEKSEKQRDRSAAAPAVLAARKANSREPVVSSADKPGE